jgi:hypothetical protein
MNALRPASFVIAAALLAPLAGSARADVAPPEPSTTWRRNQEPSTRSVMVAGVSLSAAAIAVGLLLSRLPPLRTWTLAVVGVAAVGALAIAVTTVMVYRQAEKDRAAWRAYDVERTNRRRNWQPPPEFRDLPPIAAPQASPPAEAPM